MKFRKIYELACKDCVNLQCESARIKKGHQKLVEKTKNEICTCVFRNLERKHLELEDVREEVDSNFWMQ